MNQPMTNPINNIMNMSSERGNATSQNNSLISTTAAFCTAKIMTNMIKAVVITSLKVVLFISSS